MGKTALITGPSVGIGFELSKVFAKNGYKLVLVSRNLEKMKIISNEIIKSHDIQIILISKDLGRQSARQELYDELSAEDIKIDVLLIIRELETFGTFTVSTVDLSLNNLYEITLQPNEFFHDLLCPKGHGR